MRSSLLLAIVGAASVVQAQSMGCLDAFELMTSVQDQMLTDDRAVLRRLQTRLRSATEECPELRQLWELRLEIGQLINDAGEIRIASERLHLDNALEAKEVIAATNRGSFDPTKPVRKRWALVAGTSQFLDKQIERDNPLLYADRDLERMESIFGNTLGFDEVRSLTGSRFTLDGFRSEISYLRKEVQPDDLLVIYLLSHGVSSKGEPNQVSYILTYDSDNSNVQQRYLTAIGAGAFVREIYSEVRANRVLLILDTCYSGNAITGHRDYAGHPAPKLLERLAEDSGRAVIAAAGDGQRSWELTETEKQGAFVFCFEQVVSASKDTALGELFPALSRCVSETVREKVGANVSQQPAMFASEAARRMMLAR